MRHLKTWAQNWHNCNFCPHSISQSESRGLGWYQWSGGMFFAISGKDCSQMTKSTEVGNHNVIYNRHYGSSL